MDLVQPRQAYLHYSQQLEQSSSTLRSFSLPDCPVHMTRPSLNNDARKLNAETKRCCEKMDNCDVIPLQVLWRHHTRGRHFLQDGVHLSRVGTAVLAKSFKSALGMTEKQDLTAGHRSGNHAPTACIQRPNAIWILYGQNLQPSPTDPRERLVDSEAIQ